MNRSDSELRAAADLVVGEHRRLLLAAHHLSELGSANLAESDEHNAFLESFLLHYRNLIDFLEPRQSARSTDVTAEDHPVTSFEAKVPAEHRNPIDKRLSHITFHRLDVDPDMKAWDVNRMLRQLQEVWKAFLDTLAHSHPNASILLSITALLLTVACTFP